MDFAITQHLRENPYTKVEHPDLVRAKMVRAQCLLSDSMYKEAQEEAEDILKNDKNNAVALFISAESMYFRCNVSPNSLKFRC